ATGDAVIRCLRDHPTESRRIYPREAGFGSGRLADRQPQAGQEQLALPSVPQIAGVRYHHRIERAESLDDFSRLLKQAHMGIAGGEVTVGVWGSWIPLDREEEFRHRLVEMPAGKERATDYRECAPNSSARAQTERSLGMLDSSVEFPCPPSKATVGNPTA